MKEEQVAFVNERNEWLRFGGKKSGGAGENTAVVLILIYDRKDSKVFLFNRGSGASDMQDHWALTAGKINQEDFASEEPALGQSISSSSVRRAACRELMEELGVETDGSQFKKVATFWMENKSLVFSMLAWPIDEMTKSNLQVDGSEVDEFRAFSLDEFRRNQNLGDAIKFRQSEIESFLDAEFSS